MKAIIFAAGLGTRLKPITEKIPKALVEINGKPLLEYAIRRLINTGVTEIIINVHHFANQIIDFVHANNNFDIRIEFSDEQDLLLDTGGGIKKAAWFFNDNRPFFAYNVDIISDIDLELMYSQHLQSQAIVTLFVSNRETSRYLLFNEKNQLKGWYNKKTGECKPEQLNLNPAQFRQLAFNGIHVIDPCIFPLMDEWPEKFSIIDFYLSAAQKNNIQSFQQDSVKIIDVGKPETLAEARKEN